MTLLELSCRFRAQRPPSKGAPPWSTRARARSGGVPDEQPERRRDAADAARGREPRAAVRERLSDASYSCRVLHGDVGAF